MKKLLGLMLFALLIFAGCTKDDNANTTINPLFIISEGVLSNFDYATINFDSVLTDTIRFHISYSPVIPFLEDITVNIAVTDTSRVNYNNISGVKYEAMPSAAYTLSANSVTLKAGEISQELYVVFYKDRLDTTQNSMLPITISDAQGRQISTSNQTLYCHYIAIPIVGDYSVTGNREDYFGASSINDLDTSYEFNIEKEIAIVDANLYDADYANQGSLGWKYLISIDHNLPGGIVVTPNEIMSLSIQENSFVVFEATYNAITNYIYLKTGYTNSTGDDRIIEERFTKRF